MQGSHLSTVHFRTRLRHFFRVQFLQMRITSAPSESKTHKSKRFLGMTSPVTLSIRTSIVDSTKTTHTFLSIA